jgi:hypothetical protein
MTMWRKHIACWVPKCTKHIQILQYLSFLCYNNFCRNVLQCYVIHTLPLLLYMQNLNVRHVQNSQFSAVIENNSNSARKSSYGTLFKNVRITLCLRLYEVVTTHVFKTMILYDMCNCNCQ